MDQNDLSYFAGVVGGDGHLEKKKKRIVVSNKMKKTLENLRKKIKYKGSIFFDKSAKVWKYSIYSKCLYTTLQKKFNIPSGKKSARIKPPALKGKQCIKYFIAGWFDADGGIEKYHGYTRLRLKIKSRKIRDYISKQLNKFGVRTRVHDRSDLRYTVEVNRKKDVKKFLRIIPTTVGG